MQTGRTTAALGVGVVATTAAVISFSHVQHLARQAGEPELTAWLLPLSIDGAVAAAAAVVLADSRARRRPTFLTWLMLTLGLAASLAANVASAQPTWTARCVAAWPPVALALGIEVLASMGRRARSAEQPAAVAGKATTRPRASSLPAARTVRPEPHPTGPVSEPDRAPSDRLHLVDPPSSAPPRARAVRSDSTGDAQAVARIQEMDRAAAGPVPRRAIQRELACGSARASRLAALARAREQDAVRSA